MLSVNYQHNEWCLAAKHCKLTWAHQAINEHQSVYDD